ncbi:transcription factor IBH1 [Ziziphus jujuba]|uniref:Transcription factor IBH1 n=2 Tax=Ziziphus jujuba TaxID=326968 RepID=A0ABM3I009_ZIZJJ|nr:transcription factor IBH1 [Ziziphus jujuba]KAH7518752.1 hypothetical protein FEM48_Zijuj09G0204400 [Ziziphus jujuba var. spinosa]
MNPPRNPPSNPNSLKRRFTKVFLKALKKIYRHKSKTSSSSPREIWRRYRRVKLAADASMAFSVGTRRLWSQAVLWRIRSQARNRAFVKRISTSLRVKKRSLKGKKLEEDHDLIDGYDNQEIKLRKLVPGGAAMDICSLLDETAHYVKCLTTQVNMMRRIAEIYST